MVLIFLLAAALLPWLPMAPANMAMPMVAGLYVALMSGLGFVDDHRPLPARWRALVQLLLSAALLVFMPQALNQAISEAILGSLPGAWPLLAVGASLVLVWWVNLYNFMDGSNGLASCQAIVMGLAVAGLNLLAAGSLAEMSLAGVSGLLTAAVALGFLPWNFPAARIFMGDVGSYGLAAMLALTAALGLADSSLSLVTVMLLPAVFVVDASATLLTRVVTGQRWYNAHREHLYQRLAITGIGPSGLVFGLLCINTLFIWPAVGLHIATPEYGAIIVITVYLILTISWLLAGRWLNAKQP